MQIHLRDVVILEHLRYPHGYHAYSWWRHQMETFSALLAIFAGNSQVTGEFPAQRLVTRSFGIFIDLRLIKRLSKQSWGWWFETPSRPLWRHSNVRLNLFGVTVYRITMTEIWAIFLHRIFTQCDRATHIRHPFNVFFQKFKFIPDELVHWNTIDVFKLFLAYYCCFVVLWCCIRPDYTALYCF